MKWNSYDYSYLRPPTSVFRLKHPPEYIHNGKFNRAIRKIWYGDDKNYVQEEEKKIFELKALIKQEKAKIPTHFTDADFLKAVYSGKGDVRLGFKNMMTNIEWLNDSKWHSMDEKVYEFLQKGIIYFYGRDRHFRPIIIINVYKIDLKTMEIETVQRGLCYVLNVVRDHCFVPGKVENWRIIIETNSVGLMNFPFKILGSIIGLMKQNYVGTLERLYIMNPSFALNASWSVISSMMEKQHLDKIQFLKKNAFHKLFDNISPDQLEIRYGGTLKEPQTYWPPINTLHQPPYHFEKNEIDSFNSHTPSTSLAMSLVEGISCHHHRLDHSGSSYHMSEIKHLSHMHPYFPEGKQDFDEIAISKSRKSGNCINEKENSGIDNNLICESFELHDMVEDEPSNIIHHKYTAPKLYQRKRKLEPEATLCPLESKKTTPRKVIKSAPFDPSDPIPKESGLRFEREAEVKQNNIFCSGGCSQGTQSCAIF